MRRRVITTSGRCATIAGAREDCWHPIWGRAAEETFEAAKFREVFARQIEIPAALPPIAVRSAFGGLGIYRLSAALAARYCGLDDAGREVSEHVAFNEAIARSGGAALHFSAPPGARAPSSTSIGPPSSAGAGACHAGPARRRVAAAAVAEVLPAIMRALIIDPALRSKGGHHYNAVLRLQSELSKLGIGFSCLASAYADRDVVRELGCTPTFTRSVYGRDYTDAGEFARNVAETSRQLSRALHAGGPADLLILPCCDQVLAMAVARYLKRRRLRVPHRTSCCGCSTDRTTRRRRTIRLPPPPPPNAAMPSPTSRPA